MQALNSLLYWLLDLVYKEMGAGLRIPRWAPEPYLLRVPGVEGRMVAELRKLGHLLHVLARAPAAGGGGGLLEGAELLRAVREVETTATLLSTIGRAREVRGEVVEEEEVRGGVAAAAPLPPPPRVVARYMQLVASPGLELAGLRSLQHEALAELLDLEVGFVAARHAAVAKALAEWHRPELLFRWLDVGLGLGFGLGLGISVKEVTGCNSVPHVSSHRLPRRTGVTHTQRERLHISRPHPLPRNQFRSKLTCPGGRDWNRGAGMSGLVSPSLLRVCVRG